MDRFTIPVATNNSKAPTIRLPNQGREYSVNPSGSISEIYISRGDPIQIDSAKIPDFVYNEQGVGYAAMFSSGKTNSNGMILRKK